MPWYVTHHPGAWSTQPSGIPGASTLNFFVDFPSEARHGSHSYSLASHTVTASHRIRLQPRITYGHSLGSHTVAAAHHILLQPRITYGCSLGGGGGGGGAPCNALLNALWDAPCTIECTMGCTIECTIESTLYVRRMCMCVLYGEVGPHPHCTGGA